MLDANQFTRVKILYSLLQLIVMAGAFLIYLCACVYVCIQVCTQTFTQQANQNHTKIHNKTQAWFTRRSAPKWPSSSACSSRSRSGLTSAPPLPSPRTVHSANMLLYLSVNWIGCVYLWLSPSSLVCVGGMSPTNDH